ncbi:sensor histidine kinase [Solimonas terrae]|uniref:histidine kinase n=1 Tax=Solimonas terrae TaxID=1396819 RepID=A0A6M2BU26_9GAMM|nr:ATP-binding protein [Solimonas terrae]NGY05884.1 HAMP domain-containing protein [Solimonas terrae]
MSRLYRRLLLWFCAANVATLLVSVGASNAIAWYTYGRATDWAKLAQDADAQYIGGGRDGLAQWAEARRLDVRLEATLFENGQSVLGGPLLPEIEDQLPRLLTGEHVALQLTPHLLLIGERVIGRDGVARQLVGLRGPAPFHLRRETMLGVQIALSLLVIGAVGWAFARGIAVPLAALQAAAQRMAGGDLAARVGAPFDAGSDELALLAREFDRMAERIEALVTHERRLLQDVSHELRSPLARLHLILEFAQRERAQGADADAQFARAEQEIARLDHLIGELLALSRVDAELPSMPMQAVDLVAIAGDGLKRAELEARQRGCTLQLEAPATLEAVGDARLLARALDNLLGNAIKFGAGAAIVVSVRKRGTQAELDVRDHGPGVPEPDLPKLFRPFYRGSNAARTGGYGLGLAIVERVMRAHHGAARVDNAEGGGLRLVLSLPLTT